MNKNAAYKHINFEVQLTALSPLHIGNGRQLSSTGEYFAEGSQIHILDNDALMLHLQQEKQLKPYIEIINTQGINFDYIAALQKLLGCGKKEEVYKLLKNEYSRHALQLYTRKGDTDTKQGFNPESNNILRSHIRTNELAYIPGSSLKGAVRTAIIMAQLLNNRKIQTETPIKIPKKTQQKGINDLSDLSALMGMKTAQDTDDADHWTALQNSIDEFIQKNKDKPKKADITALSKTWRDIEEKLATAKYNTKKNAQGIKYQLPDFLRFTDSDTVSDDNICVHQIIRQNFYIKPETTDDTEGLDWLVECISKDAEIRTKMTLYAPKDEPKLTFLEGNKTKSLHRLINQFTLRLIQLELEQLERSDISMLSEKVALRDALIAKLKAYQSEIEIAKDQYAILRIGHGKPIFFQTIAALIDDLDKREQFLNILRGQSPQATPVEHIIPRTRTLAVQGDKNLMLGWMKLQIKKK